MTTRRWLLLVVAAAAVLLLLGRALAGVYADYLWYNALGASALWRLRAWSTAVLRIGLGAVAAAFAFVNLYAVRHSVVQLAFPRRLGNLEIDEEVPNRYLMTLVAVVSLVLGVLLALSGASSDWVTFVLAREGTPFDENLSYVGTDLGFFVYWVPFENMLWNWAFLTVIVVTATVMLLYALTPSLRWQRGSLYASAYVRRHFTVLVGVILLLLAWSFRLDMYALLTAGSGVDGAFTHIDHRVGLPGNLLLSLATLGASLIVVWAGMVGQLRLAAAAAGGVVALALVVRQVVPGIVSRSGTDAERRAREQPYVASRAGYTRRAYAVDTVARADSSMAFPSLAAAASWVPVWDAPAIVRAVQGPGAVADSTMRISWHASPSGIVANLVEPPPTRSSASRAPWSVMHVLASSADEHGAPVRITSNGTLTPDDSPIEPPLSYPGASPFAIVPDSLNRVAGTLLLSTLARLAYAWSMQDFRLLFGDLEQPRPTIIAHRDVRDRVRRLAPFFTQGRQVLPLLLGDSLFWALDLYSTSDTYPLSRHYFIGGDDRTYVRHAAVAIVEASTGDVAIVPDSTLDPVASTWVKRLPSIFATWNTLPPGVRSALPAATDGVLAQAAAFGRYGTRSDNVPARHIPVLDGTDSALASTYDLPLVLPDSRTAITYPFVDDADRLRGLLIGLGGASRGTYWYPLGAPGPRWNVVLDRLRSLDSAGNAAREGPLAHGRVRGVPVRGGIAFIQPTYRWRPQTAPSLNRLATLVGDTIRAMAPTGMPATPVATSDSSRDFRSTINTLYAQMREALRRGDWAAFGRAFDALGRALGSRGGERR
jgi:uncharacterized membrane protein (UPF0182 family)